MNCPYCNAEMELGYLRGNKGYALMWTDDPFKMTSVALKNDFWLCTETDVSKPMAYLCKACKKVIVNY